MTQGFFAFLLIAATGLLTATPAGAEVGKKIQKNESSATARRNTASNDGVAEARLMEERRADAPVLPHQGAA